MPASNKRGAGASAVLFKALAHPLRARILVVLTERSASPNELKDLLEESLSDVSYHVRQLDKSGLIELVGERRVRGAVEHYYKATARAYFSTEDWDALPGPVKAAHAGWVMQLIIGDVAEAMEAETFESRPDRYLIRTPLVLDEQGWKELTELHGENLDRTLEIQAASAERISAGGGEGGFKVSNVTACFEMPE